MMELTPDLVDVSGESREVIERNLSFASKHAETFSCGPIEPRPGNGCRRESDLEWADLLSTGEPLLHAGPAMIKRVMHSVFIRRLAKTLNLQPKMSVL